MLILGHGQKTDQLSEDDPQLPDLGGRRFYAVDLRPAGAFCVENLLKLVRAESAKSMAPLLGPF
jgi:hypothetical protein